MDKAKRRILITGGSGFIGTNYIEALLDSEPVPEILNIDITAPQITAHEPLWKACDLCDQTKLNGLVQSFRPTEVIHLAGKTDTLSDNLKDYEANSLGSKSLLEVIKACDSVRRVIITSTQFVKRPGSQPKHDQDFDPHTAYGQSKVETEQATRQADLDCVWTIIRPTNIWGPWHPRYPNEFWRVLSKGFYVHPGGRSAVRCYGYVHNVVFQIEAMLSAEPATVNKKVFYVGDEGIDLIDWVNSFSKALCGRPAMVVPRWSLKMLGWFGDLCLKAGVKFPLSSSRFASMTTDDLVPMQATIECFGHPPVSLEQGVRESVLWLQQENYVEKVFLDATIQ